MKYQIDDLFYDVEVIRKSNRNTYIRVKEDYTIFVTTNYLVSEKQIIKLLDTNKDFLIKMVNKRKKDDEKKELFSYLGTVYDIIIMPIKDIDIYENRIYTSSLDYLNKWLKKETINVFKERLDYCYSLFDEKIPYPDLKARLMKTRWGVCNRSSKTVTLNTELIKWSTDYIDYVIIHELAHLVHFNHSKEFWKVVSKYCPNYKIVRANLKK